MIRKNDEYSWILGLLRGNYLKGLLDPWNAPFENVEAICNYVLDYFFSV